MYSNKFAVSVNVNGRPLDELDNGEIHIPFDTEYALWLTNKHDRGAVAQIFIDGENVSGGGYILKPHQSLSIKRHSGEDKAFKFVALTSNEAKKAGKDGPNERKEKGLIEVRFFLEKKIEPVPIIVKKYIIEQPYIPWVNTNPWPTPVSPTPIYTCSNSTVNSPLRATSCNLTGRVDTQRGPRGQSCGSSQTPPCGEWHEQKLSEGCTVKGSNTGQQFRQEYIDIESSYTSLKVFLVGYIDEEKRNEGVESSTNVRFCSNCGAKVRHKDKFCAICGRKLS